LANKVAHNNNNNIYYNIRRRDGRVLALLGLNPIVDNAGKQSA